MEHRSLAPDLVIPDDGNYCGDQCAGEFAPDVAPEELRQGKQVGGSVNCSDSELCTFLQALAEGYLPTFYSDTSQSVQSKSMSIASKSFQRGKQTVAFHGFPSLQMSRDSTDDRGAALLTWWLEDSHAKTSAPLAAEPELTESDQACGAKWPASSARYDPASSSWKTAHCLWDEDLQWSSVTLPTWGMTRSGAVYRHPTAERPISATGSGLWPTITVCGNYNRKGASATSGDGLATAVKLWRTPNAQVTAAKSTVVKLSGRKPSDPQVGLADQVAAMERTFPTPTATQHKGWSRNHNRAHTDDRLDYTVEREAYQAGQQTPPMRLNPGWVEWLMGWPIGHTSLKPLATDKFREWQQQHGSC